MGNIAKNSSSKLKHVAIIMDGNGRWAQGRSHSRVFGHVRGARIVSSVVQEAIAQNISALTLFAFSTENWGRPLAEIKVLFALLKKFILDERTRIIKNEIRFSVIGDISKLPEETKKIIADLEATTSKFSRLKLTFAFGYGGRFEIVSAVNRALKKKIAAQNFSELTEEEIANNLMSPDLGDVDLLIRTGGDQRISNFLLWQLAYAELYFTPTKWPDFTSGEFKQIVEAASRRNRRFGTVSVCEGLEQSTKIAKRNLELIQTVGI